MLFFKSKRNFWAKHLHKSVEADRRDPNKQISRPHPAADAVLAPRAARRSSMKMMTKKRAPRRWYKLSPSMHQRNCRKQAWSKLFALWKLGRILGRLCSLSGSMHVNPPLIGSLLCCCSCFFGVNVVQYTYIPICSHLHG